MSVGETQGFQLSIVVYYIYINIAMSVDSIHVHHVTLHTCHVLLLVMYVT